MAYILVDTSVFIRLEGIYKNALECILKTCNVIGYTKEILKEYKGRARSSPLFHLRPFLQKLKNQGKLTYFRRSFIVSRVRRKENARKINYPTHNKDKKWIKAAIAIGAEHIISTNSHLLNLVPNRYNGNFTEIIEPSQYIETHCSIEK